MGDLIKKVKMQLPDSSIVSGGNDLISKTREHSVSNIEIINDDFDVMNYTVLSKDTQEIEIKKEMNIRKDIKTYTNDDFEKAVEVSKSAKLLKELDYDSFIKSLSNSKFVDLNGFNKFIKNQVKEAGFGTINGVIAAAMALAYDYAKETGDKYFYTNNFDITMRGGTDGIIPNVTNLDCRAFVQWALYNGGFKANEITYREDFENWGEKNGLVCDDITAAKPGDIFSGGADKGHIWLVIGKYDGGYYIAEEYGHKNGLVINKYSFEEHAAQVKKYNAKLYDMSKYYNNKENVRKEE